MTYVFIGLGVAFLIAFLIVRDEKGSALATVLKTATSMCFIATALSAAFGAYRFENLEYYLLVIGGLVCGLVGDTTLDCKIAYPKDDTVFTYAGMVSFAIGHILYLIAIGLYFGFSWWMLLIGVVVAVAFMAMSVFVMKLDFGKYLIMSGIYCILLFSFLLQSLNACLVDSWSSASIILLIGSFLFLVSDAILSMTYFGGKSEKIMIVANHVTYYAAQFLIAVSILAM